MNKQNNNIEKDIKNFAVDEYKEQLKAEWSKFAEDVMKEVDTELSEKVTIKELQIQSRTFLDRIDKIESLTQLKQSNNFDTGWFSKSLGSIDENTQLKTIQIRLKYAAAFSYSRYIHKILGLPLAKAIVVFDVKKTEQKNKDNSKNEDDSKVFAKEIYMSDLIKSANSFSKFYKGELNKLAYKEEQEGDKTVLKVFDTLEERLKEEYKEQEQQQQKEIERHINNVKIAYNYIVNNAKAKQGPKKGSKQFYIRLPKLTGGVGTYTFLNYGDLKEAYAAALIESHIQDINGKKDPLCQTAEGLAKDDDGGFLAKVFFDKYVTQVDSKGALLGEDVVAMHRGDKGFQYAVKATNAGLPSLQQYIDFANAAKKAKKITKKSIKEMAESWEEIDEKTGRKKGQRNRELTKTEAEEIAYIFENTIKKS